MYYVEHNYHLIKEEFLHKTLEEALTHAQGLASKDYDEMYFYVHEIKAIVSAEKPDLPVKTLEVTVDTQHLLTSDKSE